MFLDESSCLFGQIVIPPKFRVCHNSVKKGPKVMILGAKIGCTLPGVLRELTRNRVVGPVLTVFVTLKRGQKGVIFRTPILRGVIKRGDI